MKTRARATSRGLRRFSLYHLYRARSLFGYRCRCGDGIILSAKPWSPIMSVYFKEVALYEANVNATAWKCLFF